MHTHIICTKFVCAVQVGYNVASLLSFSDTVYVSTCTLSVYHRPPHMKKPFWSAPHIPPRVSELTTATCASQHGSLSPPQFDHKLLKHQSLLYWTFWATKPNWTSYTYVLLKSKSYLKFEVMSVSVSLHVCSIVLVIFCVEVLVQASVRYVS